MKGGTWTRKTPLPVAISEVGVGEVDDKIYVVGGTEQRGSAPATGASTLTMMYDPARDRWEERAPLPRPLSHVGVAALAGKLYALGGLSDNVHLGPQSLALVYDPRTNRWSELPPLSSPRGSVAAAACGDRIHALGGHDSRETTRLAPPGRPQMLVGIGTVATHEAFDPASSTWSPRSPLPGPPRDHMGVVALAGKIHVFGGRINDYSDMLDRHDVYDPASDVWAPAAPLPRPRSAGAFTVLDDLIIYAGGECKPGGLPFTRNAFEDVTAYDARSDTWLTLSPLPEGRHAFGAATVAGVAYFAGGALLCGGGASMDLLALTLS